jgi:hypothetical protein
VLENFVGISPQGFQWIPRIGPLAQIPRAGSQIATALAVRELHFTAIFNEFIHFFRSPCLYIQGSDQRNFSIPIIPMSGIRIAQVAEATNMEAKDFTIRETPCSSPLPELEVPMINTMVACLGVEHRKLNRLNMQLAYAATSLAGDFDTIESNQKVVGVWDEIRQILWSHLQIEDELVSWGAGHHAISSALLGTLKDERQEMRKLFATLRELSSGVGRGKPQESALPSRERC